MNKYLSFIVLIPLVSCSLDSSPKTGWDYNNPRNGGFQKVPFIEQETGPGLELIQGGLLTIPTNDTVKKVIVPSFYLDRTEITNRDWCEYLYWTNRTYGNDFPEITINALPDTNAWRNVQGYSEAMELNYLRHPAFANYPVVGVSWIQANNYCAWRTDRVNEYILIREGVLLHNPNQQNEPFTTEAYLSGQYESGISYKGQLVDLDPSHGGGKDLGTRIVRREDGILLPRYRLPTEAEWEYAYVGASSESLEEQSKNEYFKKAAQNVMGEFVKSSNYNRFNGYIVAPVDAYLPNDYGIYNLAGNVQEWTMDSYRNEQRLYEQQTSPYIGNNMEVPVRNSELQIEDKLSMPLYDLAKIRIFISEFELLRLETEGIDSLEYELFYTLKKYVKEAEKSQKSGRTSESSQIMAIMYHDILEDFNSQYRNANFGDAEMEIITYLKQEMPKYIIDFPGNIQFSEITPWQRINARNGNTIAQKMMDSIFISNETKIVKGASWIDENNLMDPFQRRTLNQFENSATIGFRCAMDRLGSPVGIGKKNNKKSVSKTALD